MINNKFRQGLVGNTTMFERPEGEDSVEPLRFVVLSAEGTQTERNYFEHLTNLLETNNIKLQFHVLEHTSGENAPEDLLKHLQECRRIQQDDLLPEELMAIIKKELSHEDINNLDKLIKEKPLPEKIKRVLLSYGIDIDYHMFIRNFDPKLDTFAVVLDRDKDNHSEKTLRSVKEKCKEEGFDMCLSNPCFEFWLFLHIWDKQDLSDELKGKMLENKDHYMSSYLSKRTHHRKKITKGKFTQLYSHSISSAIQNASFFSTDFFAILSNLGTNLGVFMSALEKKYQFHFPN